MPNLKHYDNENTFRFITFNCYQNQPSLNFNNSKELLIKQIEISRANTNFKLLGYVIMPEHVHLVMYPQPGTKVGLLISTIKARMARKYFRLENIGVQGALNVFWQKRCYDHNCRTVEKVREKIIYCHNNPVKRGLVESPGEWKWSSYAWYRGERDVPISIDEYEL